MPSKTQESHQDTEIGSLGPRPGGGPSVGAPEPVWPWQVRAKSPKGRMATTSEAARLRSPVNSEEVDCDRL